VPAKAAILVLPLPTEKALDLPYREVGIDATKDCSDSTNQLDQAEALLDMLPLRHTTSCVFGSYT
jgi:hypothetical protein